jgi:hypothetical protein
MSWVYFSLILLGKRDSPTVKRKRGRPRKNPDPVAASPGRSRRAGPSRRVAPPRTCLQHHLLPIHLTHTEASPPPFRLYRRDPSPSPEDEAAIDKVLTELASISRQLLEIRRDMAEIKRDLLSLHLERR